MGRILTTENRIIQDRCVVDVDRFDAWLAQRGYAWQKLARGEYGFTLEQAQLRHICEDPVLWCRAFLNEADPSEAMVQRYGDNVPYQFWDYQEISVRHWFQDVVHQDGAEVGKTREISAILIWGMCTSFGFTVRNPSVLVGAPQQTHLDEIIMAIEAHVGENDASSGRKPWINRFWVKPKKHPHYMMKFRSPDCSPNQLGLVYFRPAGHDGEAFRGVHVNAGAFFDEAAKVKNPVCWSEFWRACKPGCFRRVYSVHDGDTSSEFHKYTGQAIKDLPPETPGWRLFHWPKSLMPHPFWSPERDREFQRLYGGKDAPGYIRNVLGLPGQQENPVWSWSMLEANIRNVPDYRAIKIRIDESHEVLELEVYSVTMEINNGKKHGVEALITERTEELTAYTTPATRREAISDLLREFIEPIEQGVLWGGADLGFSNDPTEILISQELGHEMRDRVRIQAKGVSYDLQCELIYALDELLGFNTQFGIDFGSAGTAVVQMLQNLEIYQKGEYCYVVPSMRESESQ